MSIVITPLNSTLTLEFGGKPLTIQVGEDTVATALDRARAETAANLAEAYALALAEAASYDSYNQYYVDAAASGSGNGSLANPWTWAQATANSGANPSGLTFPACINVNAGTYTNVNSNVRVTGQTAAAPIVFRGTPGQAMPIIRSSVAVTWTRTINEVGRQVYESNEVFSAGSFINFGGHIKIGGQWYPLPIVTKARLESTTGQTYRVDGDYYIGPCIARDQTSGKFYIRLDPPTSAAQLGSERTFATTVSTVPTDYEIMIDNGQNGLKPFSGHMKFVGLRFENHYQSVAMNASGGPFEGVQCINCELMPNYQAINLGRMKNSVFVNCLMDGRMTRDWWVCYWDIKGGATIAEKTRKPAIVSAGPGASFTDGAKFTGNRIINFFDGFLGEGHNIEVGGYDPYDPNSDEKAWAFGNYIDCWDDAAQIFSQNQGFHFHHNICVGAGVSRDGATSGADRGSNWPLVYSNVFWPQAKLFYGRDGAIDGDGIQIREGMVYPPAHSAHGILTGATQYRFPWHYISNTTIIRLPDVITGPAAVGARGIDLVMGLAAAGNHSGGRNLIANNVFAIDGFDEFRAAAVAAGHPGNFSLWFAQNMLLGRNDEIIDGNVFLGHWGSIDTVANSSTEDYFHIRTVRNSSNVTIGERFSWAEMAANATMLAAMQVNYSAAYQQDGVEFPSGNLATSIINPLTYQSLTSADISDGGVDLTSLVPLWRVWKPGRGAKS